MKRTCCVTGIICLALMYHLQAIAGDVIPSKYVGVWATENSVFNGMALIGGQAVYLDADGEGAMVGAPLPVQKSGGKFFAPIVGIKFHAKLEKNENLIRIDITDYGEKKSGIGFAYDAENETLAIVQPGKDNGEKLKRRFDELSESTKAMLHEPIASPYNRVHGSEKAAP